MRMRMDLIVLTADGGQNICVMQLVALINMHTDPYATNMKLQMLLRRTRFPNCSRTNLASPIFLSS